MQPPSVFPLPLPVLELGVAMAKGEDRVRKTFAHFLGGVDAYQNRAVGAAFNIPGVRLHIQL
jgi:hypothetical protein